MSEQLATLSWKFQGGFATDLAPETRELSFLVRALNVIYEVSGSIRKVGGANRINSSAIASGANITGMTDAHFAGTGGSFTDRFVALASDGTMASGGCASRARTLRTAWQSTRPTKGYRWHRDGKFRRLRRRQSSNVRGCDVSLTITPSMRTLASNSTTSSRFHRAANPTLETSERSAKSTTETRVPFL